MDNKQQRAENVFGMFRTVAVDPSIKNLTPKNWFDQIVYYKDPNSSTKKLFFYDVANHTWSYTTLT